MRRESIWVLPGIVVAWPRAASAQEGQIGYTPAQELSKRAEPCRQRSMRIGRAFAAAMSCLLAIGSAAIAVEPKPGGIFRIYHRDSPGSASIHEGATNSINIPFMPVFNNLVIYDQHIAQNSLDDIRPELAESWAWSADKKTLTSSTAAKAPAGSPTSRASPSW